MKKILSALVLCVALCFSFTGCEVHVNGLDTSDYNEVTVDEKISHDLKDIEKLNIKISVADVKFIEGTGDEVSISIHGKVRGRMKQGDKYMSCEKRGNALEFETKDEYKKVNNSGITAEVHLPKSYSKELKVDVGVGDVFIEGYEFSKLTGNMGVGEVLIKDVKAPMDIKAGVGDVKVELSQLAGDVTIKNGTGDVSLTMPDNAEFSLNAKKGVGDVKNSFGSSKVGSGKYQVDLKTGVGDVTVNKK